MEPHPSKQACGRSRENQSKNENININLGARNARREVAHGQGID